MGHSEAESVRVKIAARRALPVLLHCAKSLTDFSCLVPDSAGRKRREIGQADRAADRPEAVDRMGVARGHLAIKQSRTFSYVAGASGCQWPVTRIGVPTLTQS